MNSKHFMERGQALILIAFAAIGLFAMTGLAIDGSNKYSDRRNAQNAADTAALTAALTKTKGLTVGKTASKCSTDPVWSPSNSAFCWDIINAAWDIAGENGYDGFLGSDVEVYSPPISGPYKDMMPYTQVIITSNVDTYFARVIGINQTQNIVEATALSEKGGNLANGAMIISYDPEPGCSGGAGSGGGSVDVSGNGTINLHGGGIFLNSKETCGYASPSCSVILNIYGGGISSAGLVDNIDQGTCGTSSEQIQQDQIRIPNGVYMPEEPDACKQLASAYQTGPNEWHITPGYYSDFPQANINGDIVGNKKDIVMDPGVYCVGKSIHWSGNTFDSLDGTSGVTIYLKKGFDFDLSIDSPITLYAPHTGSDYDGYLIIQDGDQSDIGSCTINGGVYLDIEGTIFAPYCDITVNGGSDPTAEINAQLVGWDIKLNGNNTINFNYNPDKTVKIKPKVGLMK